MNKEIIDALHFRYAVQTFNPSKKISPENLHTILESAQLAPSSIGLEAWKFLVIENKDIREQLKAVAYGQSKVSDASHLVVLTYRTDHENMTKERLERTAKNQNESIENLNSLKAMADGGIARTVADGSYESWMKAQTYIPLGMMMETASLLKIDNAAMEGFDAIKVNEILGLKDKNLKVATMLALGYRGEDLVAKRPKTRRDFADVVEFI